MKVFDHCPHGEITLLDVMPHSMDVDKAVCDAARVSYSSNKDKEYTPEEDRGLIRYLMRHDHGTPFEMAEFKFFVRLPIFVARQWVRHRTASLNEVSGRYSVLPDTYYEFPSWQGQSATNKQSGSGEHNYSIGSYGPETADWYEVEECSFMEYESRIKAGVAREQSRGCLPLVTYTEWVWKCDLRNILHFLTLRTHSHAQWEIRQYANCMLEQIKHTAPFTFEAWEDFKRGSLTLTRLEVEAIQRGDFTLCEAATKRERAEWDDKLSLLHLTTTQSPSG